MKGNCTKVHSEHTANWPYIKEQGREKVEESRGKGQLKVKIKQEVPQCDTTRLSMTKY